MVSFEVLAQVARGIECIDQTFDSRVKGLNSCGPSAAEEAPTAPLVPVLHKDRSDHSADAVNRFGFFS
jgi:hypothetical protein